MDKAINKRLSELGVSDNNEKRVLIDEYVFLDIGDVFRDDDEYFDVHEKQWIKFKDSDADDVSEFVGSKYKRSWFKHKSGDFKGFRRKIKKRSGVG